MLANLQHPKYLALRDFHRPVVHHTIRTLEQYHSSTET